MRDDRPDIQFRFSVDVDKPAAERAWHEVVAASGRLVEVAIPVGYHKVLLCASPYQSLLEFAEATAKRLLIQEV